MTSDPPPDEQPTVEPPTPVDPATDAATERLELHARVTKTTHEAIHEFAAIHGFTVTALLEEWAETLDVHALALIPGARKRTAQARRRRRNTG